MSRPREPLADALRVARGIVEVEGAAFATAARGAEPEAMEAACDHLAARIAEAIVAAERDAVDRAAAIEDVPHIPQFALFVRAAH